MSSQEDDTTGENSHLLAGSRTHRNYSGHSSPGGGEYTAPSGGILNIEGGSSAITPRETSPQENCLIPHPVAASTSLTAMSGDRGDSACLPGLKTWLQDISLPVYILIMFFAISSWIDINGLWVEVPLLVNELPEAWNLPSYIIIIIQLANVGPLVYTILVKIWPNRVKEWPVVYVIITVGALSCLALVFFWDRTSEIDGNQHSTGLLTLTFFLSLVDCTSSVVYLPYMALFKPQYMSAFYIGEGLSGLIPGLVGLAQGVGGDPECVNASTVVPNNITGENDTEWNIYPEYPPPNFSVEVFFFFLFCMIIVSGLSFTCIHFLPFAKRERLEPVGLYEITPSSEVYQNHSSKTDVSDTPDVQGTVTSDKERIPETVIYQPESHVEGAIPSTNQLPPKEDDEEGGQLTQGQFVFLLVMTGWINALTNGVLPSTQSYTCLPYGNLAYTLTVRLSTVANPLACFLALFVPLPTLAVVGVLTFLGSTLAGYQLALAALSPEPPLQGEALGEFLVITTAVILTALFSYTKVSIASLLRRDGGRSALIWCGGITQVGSFVGAMVTFVLVNVLQLFESMPACPVI